MAEEKKLTVKNTEAEFLIFEKGTGDATIEVRYQDETLWMTQKAMAALFDVNVPAISKHLQNIYDDGELDRIATVSKMETVQTEGNRTISRTLSYYDLDMIISVGYRVNSIKGVRFRQWATRALRNMLLQRLSDMRRIDKLELRMDKAELNIKQIQGGVNYLVKQLAAPSKPPKRNKIGFHP